jgi:hypothetical protein
LVAGREQLNASLGHLTRQTQFSIEIGPGRCLACGLTKRIDKMARLSM